LEEVLEAEITAVPSGYNGGKDLQIELSLSLQEIAKVMLKKP
jgi:hypothetical protein